MATEVQVQEQEPTFDILVHDFRKQWGVAEATARKAHKFARQSVTDAWSAGCMLAKVKERLPHGEWMPWVEKEGLSISASKRLLLLSELEKGQVGLFDTVDAALPLARNTRIDRKRLARGEPLDEPPDEQPPAEPPAPVVDERETLRMRTEDAEQRANDAELKLQEVQDRAEVVLARDSDDSRASDIWKETETATQATKRARSELVRVQGQMVKLQKADKAKERKLNAVKRDLLKLAQAAELREACNAVLVKHFDIEVVVDDEGGNDGNAE